MNGKNCKNKNKHNIISSTRNKKNCNRRSKTWSFLLVLCRTPPIIWKKDGHRTRLQKINIPIFKCKTFKNQIFKNNKYQKNPLPKILTNKNLLFKIQTLYALKLLLFLPNQILLRKKTNLYSSKTKI